MELRKSHWIGIVLALVVLLASVFLMGTKYFLFVFGVGIFVAVCPFVFGVMAEAKEASEKEEMFLEFTRNLVESVKTGTPISKSILNVKQRSYGILSDHVEKLANQISLGIPLNFALEVFAKDLDNQTISRAITLIGQAERAGGDIGEILEAVAGAVTMSDKLTKERRAAISALVTQGYIIFFVFMIIILVMQFKILPMVSNITGTGAPALAGISAGVGQAVSTGDVSNSFFYLLIVQGFFSGITVGKLSEGNVKAGVRHSFALILIAFLFSAGANILFG